MTRRRLKQPHCRLQITCLIFHTASVIRLVILSCKSSCTMRKPGTWSSTTNRCFRSESRLGFTDRPFLQFYGTFKGWAWQPIPGNPAVIPAFHGQVKKHLDEIMKKYGAQTAYFLEMLTHQEEPWRRARGPIPPDEPSHAVITHDSMKHFYRAMLNGKKQA